MDFMHDSILFEKLYRFATVFENQNNSRQQMTIRWVYLFIFVCLWFTLFPSKKATANTLNLTSSAQNPIFNNNVRSLFSVYKQNHCISPREREF